MEKKIFTWGILIFLLLIFHIEGLFEVNNLDDLSLYRASSYITKYPDDPLLVQLKEDLQGRSTELGEYRYRRYQVRLGFPSNYTASNWLVGLLERLPLYSAYQSVFFANLLLHVLAVASTFLAFDRLFKSDSNLFRLSFLLSLSPSIFFYPVHIGHLFPFQNISEHVLWSAAVPRGASLTFFFASLLFWLNIGEPAVSRRLRLGFGLILLLASILSHRSGGLLLAGTMVAFAFLYRFLKVEPRAVAERFGMLYFLVMLDGLIVLMAVLKLVFLVGAGVTEVNVLTLGSTSSSTLLVKNVAKLLAWTFGVNILASYWLRLGPEKYEKDRLWQAGESFFRYLVPFSVIGIGLNIFHPDKSLWWGSLHYLTEGCLRISGLAHILWWMVFGTWLHVRLRRRNKLVLYTAISTVVILLSLTTTLQLLLRENKRASIVEIFKKEKLTIQVSWLLALPGKEPYVEEILYFQAIANELRKKNSDLH